MNELMMSVVSGEKLVDLLVVVVVWGLILAVLWWGLKKINPPEPWKMVGTVILVLITVAVLVNSLLGLIGKEIIKW